MCKGNRTETRCTWSCYTFDGQNTGWKREWERPELERVWHMPPVTKAESPLPMGLLSRTQERASTHVPWGSSASCHRPQQLVGLPSRKPQPKWPAPVTVTSGGVALPKGSPQVSASISQEKTKVLGN